MPSTYFDASAVVKLVLDEPGSAAVRDLWRQSDRRFAGTLTHVEACAAVAAAHRNHQLDAELTDAILVELAELRRDVREVTLGSDVATIAAELARTHGLRGADACHLSSALALRDPDLIVATWDRRLHAAAQAVGLRVAPPALAAGA